MSCFCLFTVLLFDLGFVGNVFISDLVLVDLLQRCFVGYFI